MKDWLPNHRQVPSWVLSTLFHGVMVWLLLTLMPAWDRPPVGFTDEPSQQIGIFVKERGVEVEPRDGVDVATDPAATATTDSTPAASDPLAPRQAVPDLPAMTSPLPQAESLPGIGPGAPLSGGGLPDPQQLIKSSGTGTGAAAASGGIPGTAFLGVKDHGTQVVFVVDSSGSMYQHNAMRAAKAALVSSISSLEPSQQFQVIFYNETPRTMTLRSAPKRQLYFATDVNKQGARQFIQQIEPDLGTRHVDAIKLGLSFGPEVMFVLTDSGDPQLTPRELDEIARRNGGRTRIHAIEFGVGAELKGMTANFLVKLSRQNDGTHRYVDVMQFARP